MKGTGGCRSDNLKDTKPRGSSTVCLRPLAIAAVILHCMSPDKAPKCHASYELRQGKEGGDGDRWMHGCMFTTHAHASHGGALRVKRRRASRGSMGEKHP